MKRKYEDVYEKVFFCISTSNKNDERAFCTKFSVDISVAHGGRDNWQHYKPTIKQASYVKARDVIASA